MCAMMRYNFQTVNLISWASILFALVQLFALLIARSPATLFAIISQTPVFLTIRLHHFGCLQ